MRHPDVARLFDPYPEGEEPSEEAALAAIDLSLPNWNSLKGEVLADFVEGPPYGVGWWSPHPGTKRRILISDQLACCLDSVATNLIEAKLHLLDFLHATECEDLRYVDALRMTQAGLGINLPKPGSPHEQLTEHRARMHRAGMIRALASALDCLSGVIIGVVALRHSILRADFKAVRRNLKNICENQNIDHRRQAHFSHRLEDVIGNVGPRGWLDWTLDFRNMLVHRGRRIDYGQIVPIQSALYGPDGNPFLRAQRFTNLPREPGRSDVEVFSGQPWRHILYEDSRVTLTGLMKSTSDLIESVANDLREFWQGRRLHPNEICQPKEQWPEYPSAQPVGFEGYAPSTHFQPPDIGMVHPATALRMRAAAITDDARSQWESFD